MEKNLKKRLFLFLNKIVIWFKTPSINRKITILLIILSFFASIVTYLVFSNSLPYIETTPTIAITTLTIDVILLLGLCFKVIRKIVQTRIERRRGVVGAKISAKFILTFGLLVLIPTVTLATFSTFFFNIGMKGWFNDKMLLMTEQSNAVAESYLKEYQESIKNDALAISKEINQKFNTVFIDLNKLNIYLNSQTDIRELTEAFIFKKGGES